MSKPIGRPIGTGGTPHYEHPNDVHAAIITRLSRAGIPQKKIARFVGVADITLTDNYGDILNQGMLDRVVQCADTLFEIAMNQDDVKVAATACMFILKCQGGWKENSAVEDVQKLLTRFVDGPPQETMEEWKERKGRERSELGEIKKALNGTGSAHN